MQSPVLVVEDDQKLSRIIRAYLEGADFRVSTAFTAEDALKKAEEELPLAVILDLGLPGSSGEELCQDLKDLADIPVIILTAKSSEEERLAGFALGADDYMIKPASPRELICRLKAILKRYDSANMIYETLSFNNATLVINNKRHELFHNGKAIIITPTEFKLLLTLASVPHRTFTRDELVSKALGYQFEGYERSIDAHIKNIRQKIEDNAKSPIFLKTVYGVGYVFCGERDAL